MVIDARHTDFRPCLKPEIFGEGKRLYPGEYVNLQEAIRYGYVRYYRKTERAQQSARSGSLPYIVKAQGTFNGKSALAIGTKVSGVLKTIIGKNENFLASCHVVIVF